MGAAVSFVNDYVVKPIFNVANTVLEAIVEPFVEPIVNAVRPIIEDVIIPVSKSIAGVVVDWGFKPLAAVGMGAVISVGNIAPPITQTVLSVRSAHFASDVQKIDGALKRTMRNGISLDGTGLSENAFYNFYFPETFQPNEYIHALPIIIERKTTTLGNIRTTSYNVFAYTNLYLSKFWEYVEQDFSENLRRQIQRENCVLLDHYQVSTIDVVSHQLLLQRERIFIPMRVHQAQIVNEILQVHEENKFQTTSVLVHGAPGTGKSTIASYIAHNYRLRYPGRRYMFVKGFDLKLPLLNIHAHVLSQRPDEDTLLILLLDDIDKSIHYAIEPRQDPFPQNCYAKDKTQLTTFLDYLNSNIPNCIVIATSNTPLQQLQEIDGGCFVRQGRFNHKFELNLN